MVNSGIRVLFVEDDPTMQALFGILAKPRVEKILQAKDGIEGLDVFTRERPDLVLTDIQMPGMSGMDMLRKIREIDTGVSCVVLSAYSNPEYFIDAIDIGVQGFLLKPLEKEKLHRLLDQLIENILLKRRMQEQEERRLEAEENLRRLNEELENRVAARTKELEVEITERMTAQERLIELNRDLEDRVKAELRKREKQQKLLIQKSKLESMGELAAGMAHELNQPLSGISMGMDNIDYQLSTGKLTDEYLRNKIGAMFRDIERIRHIIEHVRTFSRDQEKERIEKFALNEVLTNAMSLIETQYRNQQVKLKLTLAATPMYSLGNPFKLEQVLLNLLSNAKFAVEAKASKTSNSGYEKEILISLTEENEMVVLAVTDNGTGISSEHLDRIFDPFFTTKEKESGTGLGLSIVYGIVKDMGGDIKVKSKPDMFTSISVLLPKSK